MICNCREDKQIIGNGEEFGVGSLEVGVGSKEQRVKTSTTRLVRDYYDSGMAHLWVIPG